MSVRRLFHGQTIVLTLFVVLVWLTYYILQSPDSVLSKLLTDHPQPTHVLSQQTPEEDLIEEHEPDEIDAKSEIGVQGISIGKQIAQVVKVTDGDTITVVLNKKNEKIRIVGLNTPETVDPRKSVECFGREASAFAKKMLTGKTVYLESDPSQSDRDRYGRLLRFVFLENGQDYGKLAIQEGYGYEYTYDIPYKYQSDYKQAEQQARQNKKGLWADSACK